MCTSCKDTTQTPDPLINACHCSGNKGTSGGIYSVTCAACDNSCATCNLAGNPSSCLTCNVASASVLNILGGTCPACHSTCATCTLTGDPNSCLTCKVSNVSAQDFLAGACVTCPNNCPYCVDTDPASCLSEAEVDFALTATSLYGLPKLTEQDNYICYRYDAVENDESRCALEHVVGTLAAGTITLTKGLCYKLLHSDWPMQNAWFANLFSGFAPPNTASDAEKLQIKTILQLWILQFSPINMETDPDWLPLVAAFNTAGADWGKYLGWTGTPGRYTLDGSTSKAFPEELSTWLNIDAGDLVALNMKSTVCDTAGCGFANECWSVNPSLACSVAP